MLALQKESEKARDAGARAEKARARVQEELDAGLEAQKVIEVEKAKLRKEGEEMKAALERIRGERRALQKQLEAAAKEAEERTASRPKVNGAALCLVELIVYHKLLRSESLLFSRSKGKEAELRFVRLLSPCFKSAGV